MTALNWSDWSFDPSVILGMSALIAAYAYLHWRFPHDTQRAWRIGAAALAVISLFLALESPLDYGGDHFLFFLHMIQHMALNSIVAPLLLVGIPSGAWRAFAARSGWANKGAKLLAFPALGAVLANVLVLGWHVPALFNATLTNGPLHITSHLSFVAAGLLMWWPVMHDSGISREGREHSFIPLAKIIYIVLAVTPMMLFGFGLIIAPAVIYTYYLHVPRLWGITALTDQRIGGMVMVGIDTVACLTASAIWFFTWFEVETEDDEWRFGEAFHQPDPTLQPGQANVLPDRTMIEGTPRA